MEEETKIRACVMCKGTGAIWSGVGQTTCLGCNGTGKAKATQIATVEQARADFEQAHGKTPEEAIAEVKLMLQGIVREVQPVIQSIIGAWQKVWDEQLQPFLHAAYIEQGAPYVDTEEGLLRWLRELGERQSQHRERGA